MILVAQALEKYRPFRRKCRGGKVEQALSLEKLSSRKYKEMYPEILYNCSNNIEPMNHSKESRIH